MRTNLQTPRPATKQTPAPRPSRMKLSAAVRGPIAAPLRVCLYSTEGLGKSTWASHAPSPIFLCSERGTERLDVVRMPEPHTWAEVLEAVRELTEAEHDFKTLVIDTVDWLEPLVWRTVAERSGKASIADIPYGRGYEYALDEWRRFIAALERLQDVRRMDLVLLAHAHIKTFRNPEGDDFDRYQLKLHEKAAGLFKEWVEVLLFGNFETVAVESGGRHKGVSTGARVVHTERAAPFDAKNRHSLPPVLPLSWEDFAAAVTAGAPADPTKLREEITRLAALLEDAPAELFDPEAFEQALAAAQDDAAQLARIRNRLSAKLAQKES